MPTCLKCGTEITLENIYLSYLADAYYVCKDCARKQQRAYYQRNKNDPDFQRRRKRAFHKWYTEHREDFNTYMRNYNRKHRLTINGRSIKVEKREHPGNCELCGREVMLFYHHWDDENPGIGLWLCGICHWKVELIEHPENWQFYGKYLQLKSSLSAQIMVEAASKIYKT